MTIAPSATTAVSVLIVDDHEDLCEALVDYLALAGHDVRGVNTCLDFYRCLAERPADVAVVDQQLPDQDGLVLVRYLRQNTDIGIIILSGKHAMDDRVRGYHSGADLFFAKPVDSRELEAAIVSLAQRRDVRPLLASDRPAVASWRLRKKSWLLSSPAGKEVHLTTKELQFVSCLVERAGQPVTRETLRRALGYGDDEYAKRSMDTVVRRLRRKICDELGVASPIRTLHAIGYSFAAPVVVADQ